MPNKKQTTVTLDEDVMEFLKEQIEVRRFSSFSHGINYAVHMLRRLDETGMIHDAEEILGKKREESE